MILSSIMGYFEAKLKKNGFDCLALKGRTKQDSEKIAKKKNPVRVL